LRSICFAFIVFAKEEEGHWMRGKNQTLSSKSRLLELIKLLYEQTDEDHQFTTNDILEYMSNKGMVTNRKTVKADIDLLNQYGIDIIVTHSMSNSFFMGERVFQIPEIKMLMDSVISSKAITEHKSTVLLNKLKSLVSVHQAEELSDRICFRTGIKSSNENIYYTVDAIHNAIRLKKKIQFRKYDYSVTKERIYRDNGKVNVVSPYELVWYEDKYYLIGYFEDIKGVSNFRVDNIETPTIMPDDAIPIPLWFDMGEYVISMFRMYAGPVTEVELKCDNSLMRVIIDRFGKEIPTSVMDSQNFRTQVNVALSPIFYSWIFQFSGMIKIIAPKRVRDEYTKMLKQNLSSEQPAKEAIK